MIRHVVIRRQDLVSTSLGLPYRVVIAVPRIIGLSLLGYLVDGVAPVRRRVGRCSFRLLDYLLGPAGW